MNKKKFLIPLLVLCAFILGGCDVDCVPDKELVKEHRKAIDACIEQKGVPIFYGSSDLRLEECLIPSAQEEDGDN